MAFDYSAATYDPKLRRLIVSTFSDGIVGFEATNSTWQGSSWSTSGAAFFNAALVVQLVYHVYFNEVRHLAAEAQVNLNLSHPSPLLAQSRLRNLSGHCHACKGCLGTVTLKGAYC
jgi:hypothetical protein